MRLGFSSFHDLAMKQILVWAALLCCATATAQDDIKVEYRAIGKETNESNILFPDDQALIISGGRSKFYSLRQWRFEQFVDSIDHADHEVDLISIRAKQNCPKEGFYYLVFKNYPETGILTYVEKRGAQYYLYEEQIPTPEWTLVEGDTTILTYACQKAVSHFRGRLWTAWYAPELPYDNGPWKLCGLPGLILKATEQDGIFSFTATGIEKVASVELRPDKKHYTRSTRKEFVELLDLYFGNRWKFIMRQLGTIDEDDDFTLPIPPETPCLLDPGE